MDKSILVKIFGFPATLIHGDPLVLDRWLWLKKRIPKTKNGETLIDIGCGTGAFTIGATRRGYVALGLSWDERNQAIAATRAKMCNSESTKFEILDVRQLDTRKDLIGKFDVALCLENAEHIINDKLLIENIAACLKPGGRLLFTSPNYFYRPITKDDMGPFLKVETGWHVRRGYTKAMVEELCLKANLVPERISFCSGFMSQKLCYVLRKVSKIHPILGWLVVLPFRLIPPVFDRLFTNLIRWPYFSICLEAYKPRYEN